MSTNSQQLINILQPIANQLNTKIFSANKLLQPNTYQLKLYKGNNTFYMNIHIPLYSSTKDIQDIFYTTLLGQQGKAIYYDQHPNFSFNAYIKYAIDTLKQ